MAWNDEAKRVAIKVIGTVESNLKYDAINYNDPITVGIGQWYATRAANLLNQLKATGAWVGVTSRVTNALNNNAETNSGFWTSFFLNRDDGNSLKGPLSSADGINIQNSQIVSDINGYATPAIARGLDPETNTAAFIYYCQLYHQSPKYANQVLTQAGINPSVLRLHSLALNHSWYSRFKTRLNTAKRIIDDWDDDLPGSFDPSDTEEGGDGSGEIVTQIPSEISRVTIAGSQMFIHTRDGIVKAYASPNPNEWLVGADGRGEAIVPPTDPTDPGSGTPADPSDPVAVKAQALIDFLVARVDKYLYRQAAGRFTPDSSGFTDCSGLVYYAYHSVLGYTLAQFGDYTVTQNAKGRNIWSVQRGVPPESLLKPGDLCFFANDTNFSRVRHVEMYMGDGKLIGWGGPTASRPNPKGPYIKTNYSGYMNYWRWHSVRRHLDW